MVFGSWLGNVFASLLLGVAAIGGLLALIFVPAYSLGVMISHIPGYTLKKHYVKEEEWFFHWIMGIIVITSLSVLFTIGELLLHGPSGFSFFFR